MAMDERLRAVAQAGDTNELYNCIREGADVLRFFDEADFVDTPLHIAAASGHADFAIAIMYLKPSLARKLNQDVFSPIHLALQNGHTATVLRLLEVDKDLVRVKGKQGYTAFHIAVEKGNLELFAEFLKDCPACIEDVTIRNETALHIAAQNHRYETLEILVRWLERTHLYGKVSRKHLLNSKDTDGNTVLHIAASHAQPKMIRLLLDCKVDRKAVNTNHLTAFEVLESQRDVGTQNKEMSLEILCDKGGFSRLTAVLIPEVQPLHERFRSKITFPEKAAVRLIGPIINMSAHSANALLVALTLLITAIYESILSPPGGLWQGSDPTNSRVGTSAMDAISFKTFSTEINVSTLFAATALIPLIEHVTGSGILTMVVEAMWVYFSLSLFRVWQFTKPTYSDGKETGIYLYTKDPDKERAVFVCITLTCMEASRWFFLISKRLYFNRLMH